MRIGIVGAVGAGKDAAADILSEIHRIPKVSFAEPLHEMATSIWGTGCLSREQKEEQQVFGESVFEYFYDKHIKLLTEWFDRYRLATPTNMAKLGLIRDIFRQGNAIRPSISPRQFMQLYGTEFWREINQDIFVKVAADKYSSCIFADVRFPNEASVCDRLIHISREDVSPVAAHTSEAFHQAIARHPEPDWLGVPIIRIANNGTLSDLEAELISLSI